jgi:DNA polymerase-3 subunit beta
MDFYIQKQDIVKALALTSGVTEKKTIEVLSNVLIEVNESSLALTASDLESWIITSTRISNFVSGGKTTVDAKKLADLCRLLPENSEIHISYDSNKLKIEAGTGTYLLATLPSDSFPVFEDFGESEQINLKAQDLKGIIDKTSIGMASSSFGRQQLEGLYFDINETTITTIATDTSIAASASVQIENSSKCQAIVSRKAVNQISKLIAGESENILITISPNAISIEAPSFRFSSKLISGKYPYSVSQVVDYSPGFEGSIIKIDPKTFSETINRISLIAMDGRAIKMIFASDGITLAGSNRSDKGNELYKVEHTGPDMEILFDVGYFRQILSCIDEDICELNIFGNDKACTITTHGKYSNQYSVMPLLETPATANLNK